MLWILASHDSMSSLAESPRRTARSLLGAGGWRGLDLNGREPALAADGDEDAGTHATTVTYYLTFP